jgi:hypothetical protein
MRRSLLHLAVFSLQLTVITPLVAQSPSFGFLLGRSLVGGGDSRTLVGSAVTGADQAGLHLRGYLDLPLEGSAFSFRTELFYNRLTSGPSTYDARVNGKAALVDRTAGLTGSFVGTMNRHRTVTPYFSLGAGLFTSVLGHNPDGVSTRVTEEYQGMGLGLVAGGGLRVRLGRPTLLLDWRYYQGLYDTRGSSFMPFSVGLGF